MQPLTLRRRWRPDLVRAGMNLDDEGDLAAETALGRPVAERHSGARRLCIPEMTFY